MFYKNILFICIYIFLSNCSATTLTNEKQSKNIVPGYSNKGFTLIYSEDIYNRKIVNKKIDERSLILFQKNLRIKTQVRITNILNKKSLIATVGKNSKYPSFNNSVVSQRISEELELDVNQPYVEVFEIIENSIFVAQKAKTYEEEKSVAIKAPVNNVIISDLNEIKKSDEKDQHIKFSYTIKIADFYFKDTALMMLKRIKTESSIKKPKIKKFSDKKYRVYLGPFNNISSLQNSYNDISILEFENIEIIKND
jgi:hypothetical protein